MSAESGVTKAQIDALYLILLGREPESELAIRSYNGLTVADTAKRLLSSEEFTTGSLKTVLAGIQINKPLSPRQSNCVARFLSSLAPGESSQKFLDDRGWLRAFRTFSLLPTMQEAIRSAHSAVADRLIQVLQDSVEQSPSVRPPVRDRIFPGAKAAAGAAATASDSTTTEDGMSGSITSISAHAIQGRIGGLSRAVRPVVVFVLDDEIISAVSASLAGNANLGDADFRWSPGSRDARTAAIATLSRVVRKHRSDTVDPSSITVEFSVFALPAGDGAPVRLAAADGLELRRTIADWFDFFDVDLASALSTTPLEGLTPPHHQADGGAAAIAFYLPQYHPFPENDEWWGPGFTEWTNVSAARAVFEGHASPNVPADLGFYDVRVPDVRRRQGELAKDYGLYGFCYHFYWFGGKRLMHEPLELMLQDGEPDLPFCLCWANEAWSRRWDGSETDVLMPQPHDADGDAAILDDLMRYFDDPRYIRIDGKPVLVIYRISLMPDPVRFTNNLRRAALERGLPGLVICSVMSFGIGDPAPLGCDYAVEFPPHGLVAGERNAKALGADPDYTGAIYDYGESAASAVAKTYDFPVFPGVMPRWDNTARKPLAGNVFHNASPAAFEAWLRAAVSTTTTRNPAAPLLFINSWNEWGEGAHLEPDRRYGRRYLEAMQRALARLPDSGTSAPKADPDGPIGEFAARDAGARAHEARYLTKRLTDVGALVTAPDLIPGLPELSQIPTPAPGRASAIETWQGRSPQILLPEQQHQTFMLRGWSIGDAAGTPGYLYLVLSSVNTDTVLHVPVLSRFARPDVALLHGVGDWLPLGFEARFRLNKAPRGGYRMSLIEVGETASYTTSIPYILQVL